MPKCSWAKPEPGAQPQSNKRVSGGAEPRLTSGGKAVAEEQWDSWCKTQNQLQRLQVFNQIALLLSGQTQAETSVVVIDYVQQRRETAIVEETTFLMCP